LDDGTFSKPHLAQIRVNAAPHSLQNFSPSGFSVLQFEQRIGGPLADSYQTLVSPRTAYYTLAAHLSLLA
jgi:hypothetical protein